MAGSRNQTREPVEYDAGLMLYQIARLPSWNVEGVSYSSLWGKGKTPEGVSEIRAATSRNISTSIKMMYDIVMKHSEPSDRRSEKTDAFYQLIRQVYLYQGDDSSPKEFIDDFCSKYLKEAERSTLPGAAKPAASVFSIVKSLI
jgi:hypothetical protein